MRGAGLDVDLTRDDAPVVNERELVSASFGCRVHQPVNGIDLAVACKR